MIDLTIHKILAAARANPDLKTGTCRYSAPCVVGSAMTDEERATLDNRHDDYSTVRQLASSLKLSFPDEAQLNDAHVLQEAFDSSDAEYKIALEMLEAKWSAVAPQ